MGGETLTRGGVSLEVEDVFALVGIKAPTDKARAFGGPVRTGAKAGVALHQSGTQYALSR